MSFTSWFDHICFIVLFVLLSGCLLRYVGVSYISVDGPCSTSLFKVDIVQYVCIMRRRKMRGIPLPTEDDQQYMYT